MKDLKCQVLFDYIVFQGDLDSLPPVISYKNKLTFNQNLDIFYN